LQRRRRPPPQADGARNATRVLVLRAVALLWLTWTGRAALCQGCAVLWLTRTGRAALPSRGLTRRESGGALSGKDPDTTTAMAGHEG
jgi:hypothetical protein